MKNQFLSKVQITPHCWEWVGQKTEKGYGKFQKKRAHRVSYELFIGPIPPTLHVLHHCDNPSCVNPDHLFVGTNQDNIDDKVKKGRSRWATPKPPRKRGRPKLILPQWVIESKLSIKKLSILSGISIATLSRALHRGRIIKLSNSQTEEIKLSTLTNRQLAEEYGVSKGRISKIRSR